MKKLVRSLESALMVRVGETIRHPVLGPVRILGIYENPKIGFEAFCSLSSFNDTHRLMDLQELSDIKFGVIKLRIRK